MELNMSPRWGFACIGLVFYKYFAPTGLLDSMT